MYAARISANENRAYSANEISTLIVYGEQQSGSDDDSQVVSQASFGSNRVELLIITPPRMMR
jgi:hypothetical protein